MAGRFGIPVLALAGLTLAAPGGRAEEPRDAAAERVKVVRAAYAEVPPTILQLKEPIRVTQCTEQKVPVVIGLLFADADGINHSFSWWLDKGKVQNAEFDRIYWMRYKGLGPELGQNKYRLPVRGPEEVALYGVLLRWVAAKEKAKDVSLFDREMLKNVKGLLEKLDERLAGEKSVGQKW